MITRCFDQSEDADRQNKNNVTERNRSQKSPSLGDPRSGSNAIYSRRNLVCCEQKQAADRAVTDHGDLTVKIRNWWTENFPDENAYHRRQGYLPKLVTKMNEVHTTSESSVVK